MYKYFILNLTKNVIKNDNQSIKNNKNIQIIDNHANNCYYDNFTTNYIKYNLHIFYYNGRSRVGKNPFGL
jgi:hypothetical protein